MLCFHFFFCLYRVLPPMHSALLVDNVVDTIIVEIIRETIPLGDLATDYFEWGPLRNFEKLAQFRAVCRWFYAKCERPVWTRVNINRSKMPLQSVVDVLRSRISLIKHLDVTTDIIKDLGLGPFLTLIRPSSVILRYSDSDRTPDPMLDEVFREWAPSLRALCLPTRLGPNARVLTLTSLIYSGPGGFAADMIKNLPHLKSVELYCLMRWTAPKFEFPEGLESLRIYWLGSFALPVVTSHMSVCKRLRQLWMGLTVGPTINPGSNDCNELIKIIEMNASTLQSFRLSWPESSNISCVDIEAFEKCVQKIVRKDCRVSLGSLCQRNL